MSIARKIQRKHTQHVGKCAKPTGNRETRRGRNLFTYRPGNTDFNLVQSGDDRDSRWEFNLRK